MVHNYTQEKAPLRKAVKTLYLSNEILQGHHIDNPDYISTRWFANSMGIQQ